MALAALLILCAEFVALACLVGRYSPNGDVDLFIARAPLHDVLMANFRAGTVMIMLGMLSILCALRVGA